MTFFVVPCPKCGARVKIPAELVGKKVRCPKCQEVFAAPSPQAIQAAPQAFPVMPAPRQQLCPSCRNPLSPKVHFCRSCGFDSRTGTKRHMASEKEKRKKSPRSTDSTAPADPQARAPTESPAAPGTSDIYGLVVQDNPPSAEASGMLTCPDCGYDFPEDLDDCPKCRADNAVAADRRSSQRRVVTWDEILTIPLRFDLLVQALVLSLSTTAVLAVGVLVSNFCCCGLLLPVVYAAWLGIGSATYLEAAGYAIHNKVSVWTDAYRCASYTVGTTLLAFGFALLASLPLVLLLGLLTQSPGLAILCGFLFSFCWSEFYSYSALLASAASCQFVWDPRHVLRWLAKCWQNLLLCEVVAGLAYYLFSLGCGVGIVLWLRWSPAAQTLQEELARGPKDLTQSQKVDVEAKVLLIFAAIGFTWEFLRHYRNLALSYMGGLVVRRHWPQLKQLVGGKNGDIID